MQTEGMLLIVDPLSSKRDMKFLTSAEYKIIDVASKPHMTHENLII